MWFAPLHPISLPAQRNAVPARGQAVYAPRVSYHRKIKIRAFNKLSIGIRVLQCVDFWPQTNKKKGKIAGESFCRHGNGLKPAARQCPNRERACKNHRADGACDE